MRWESGEVVLSLWIVLEVMFVILHNIPEVDKGTALILVCNHTIRTGTCIHSNVLLIFILEVV